MKIQGMLEWNLKSSKTIGTAKVSSSSKHTMFTMRRHFEIGVNRSLFSTKLPVKGLKGINT